MKNKWAQRFQYIFLLTLFTLIAADISAQQKIKTTPSTNNLLRTRSFDEHWLFTRDSVTGAEQPDYNDASWKIIDLPHDWSTEDLPNQIADSIAGPFSKSSIGGTATGFVIGGTGWYRKKFVLNNGDQNKIVSLLFDGVYMEADVWLNGQHLGNHPYGYTPFYYELTKWLKPAGQENVITVQVRNWGRNSRWYSGSGIYRHTWLTVTALVHIAQWGQYITTPEVSEKSAVVQLKTTVQNESNKQNNIIVSTKLIASNGQIAGTTQEALDIAATNQNEITQNITINNPIVWSTESPRLYKAVTEIKSGNKTVDHIETSFGLRNIRLDAQHGLYINDKKILLKGGCMHHDNGPLGSATIDRAEERKIELLKKNGFNAIRTSHNPPSQQLLDACDRLGMLVIDEAFDMWERPKNPDDYHRFFDDWWQRDIDAMVLRDRNHPSVIFWSIGNEINERADSSGLIIAKKLADEVRRLDSSRPVTEAICDFWDHPGRKWETTAPAFALLDVGGYNYQWRQYEKDHQKYPDRIMMGTESFPMEALENWQQVEKHPYVIGDFVWTAVDYMGETAIGHTNLSNEKDGFLLGWPWFNAYCGDIDLMGDKKPQSYYRDVVWRQSKIEMAVHRPIPDSVKEHVSAWGWPDEMQSWTWPGTEGKPLQVRVFSRTPLIRLQLNGKIIGEQKMNDSNIAAVFNVPYQPGILKAIALENGKEIASTILQTAGVSKYIQLKADRSIIKANRNDLSYVTASVVDEKGNIVPDAAMSIHFTINGNGTIAATGSGNPADMSSFQQPDKKAYRGRCLAIVRPTGKGGTIILSATAEGLAPAKVIIKTTE